MAPEAVWQLGRPPYQSEIWYGGAIPIRDAGISLVLIPKNSLLHYFFMAARHSMSADLYFTGILLSFFFIRQLISEIAERNYTIFGHLVGSKCNLKMHVRNVGYPFPLQIGGPKTTFLGRLRNSRATLTAYILGMIHDIHNRSSALTTTRGLLRHPKMSRTQTASNLTAILPTLRKFCILLHCQASQTEISKQNSIKFCQTADGKSR